MIHFDYWQNFLFHSYYHIKYEYQLNYMILYNMKTQWSRSICGRGIGLVCLEHTGAWVTE